MTEPKKRAPARPAKAPLIQDRPADPVRDRVPDAQDGGGGFPPNPVPGVRRGRPGPTDRDLRVVGPKEVGGVRKPGRVTMSLTEDQLSALIAGGHVEPWQDQGENPDEEG